MAGPNPAPGRRRVLTYASPKVDDLIFFELRDSTLPSNRNPEYLSGHPDTSTYPNHVLVFVTAASDSEPGWQRWYYAAKRENQDDYNFELDGTSGLSRTYIIPRADYLSGDFPEPAVGATDATFTDYKYGSQDVRRIGQRELDSYFVVIVRHYANDERVQAVSRSGSARGETSEEVSLGASASAQALEAGIVVQRSSNLTEEEMWRNTEETLRLRPGVNQSTVSYEPGYKRTRTSELSEVEPEETAADQSFSKQLVLTDVTGRDAVWDAGRETLESSPATGSEVVRELGGGVASVTYNLVDDGVAADSGFLILDSTVRPLGGGDAVKVTKTLPEYPVLIEYEFDETTQSLIKITKTVVAPGTEGSYAAGDVTEVRAVDKWRSISIRSEYVSALNSVTYLPFTDSIQIPPVLRSVELKYVSAWAASENGSYDFAEDMAFVYDVREAFSVSVEGRLKRYFSPTPPLLTPTANSYQPDSHTLAYTTWWWTAGTGGASANANIRTERTPFALCQGITIITPAWFNENLLSVGREVTTQIPATPTPPTGWTTMKATVRAIKLGYYEIVEEQLNLPNPFSM